MKGSTKENRQKTKVNHTGYQKDHQIFGKLLCLISKKENKNENSIIRIHLTPIKMTKMIYNIIFTCL